MCFPLRHLHPVRFRHRLQRLSAAHRLPPHSPVCRQCRCMPADRPTDSVSHGWKQNPHPFCWNNYNGSYPHHPRSHPHCNNRHPVLRYSMHDSPRNNRYNNSREFPAAATDTDRLWHNRRRRYFRSPARCRRSDSCPQTDHRSLLPLGHHGYISLFHNHCQDFLHRKAGSVPPHQNFSLHSPDHLPCCYILNQSLHIVRSPYISQNIRSLARTIPGDHRWPPQKHFSHLPLSRFSPEQNVPSVP